MAHSICSVQHLVLDEADRMLDAEFMDQIQEIVATCSNANVRKALFSATLPAGAEKVAMSMLENPIRIVVGLKYVLQSDLWRITLTIQSQRYASAIDTAISYICCR